VEGSGKRNGKRILAALAADDGMGMVLTIDGSAEVIRGDKK
jgi:hypothetical protein